MLVTLPRAGGGGPWLISGGGPVITVEGVAEAGREVREGDSEKERERKKIEKKNKKRKKKK